MVKEGCLDGIDEAYAYHNDPHVEENKVAVKEGPLMSEGTKVNITFIGAGGHGSAPDKAKDPL